MVKLLFFAYFENMLDTIVENLRIEVAGEGDIVLVFAHGFGGRKEDWDRYVAYFKTKATVVSFDHLGSIQVDIPEEFIDLRFSDSNFHTELLISIIKKYCTGKKVCLVAHSYSGLLGVNACLKEPGLIDELVLIGSSPRYINDRDYFGGIGADGVDQIFQQIAENFMEWVGDFKGAMLQDDDQNGNDFTTSILRMGPKRALAIAKAIFLSDYREQLKHLEIPTLVIHSSPDPIVSDEAAQFLCSNIRDVRCEVIKAGGHFPHLHRYNQVISLIEDFAIKV